MHDGVIRKRRRESSRLAGVGADGLNTDAQNIPLRDKKFRRALMKSRRVRSVAIGVQKRRAQSLAPIGAQQHPRTRWNAAVNAFPAKDVLRREQKIVVSGAFAGGVDHAGGSDKSAGGNGVGGVLRKVLARHPVHRCIEVRAGVLAHRDCVPVPAGALVVVARDLRHRHTWRRRKHVRQRNHLRIGAKRDAEVDDLHAAVGECGDKVAQCE